MSNNPVHVRMYVGRQFHRLLQEEAERALASGNEPKYIELRSWRLKITSAKRGKTFYRWNKVTIPQFAVDRGRGYALYYMLHELSHVLIGPGHAHDASFKALEEQLLERFNIEIVRRPKSKNGYPQSVSLNGEAV